MAWGCNLTQLPACNTYAGALKIWDRAEVCRGWETDARPLKDKRSTHYAVQKIDNEIAFRLYRTPIVIWHDSNTVTINNSYDSFATDGFLYRFSPNSIQSYNYKGQRCIEYQPGKLIRAGRYVFEFDGNVWVLQQNQQARAEKPTRRVQDPDIAAEIRKQLKPMLEWARGLWAVCGDDGSHPWIDVPYIRIWNALRIDMSQIQHSGMDYWECIIKGMLPAYPGEAGKIDFVALKQKILRNAYESNGAYIDIPYDEPLPKRKK